ncbi:ferritin-like domain-containing protein [Marixanthomonas sp. SCSIO 43207]|uniref:ferritin-like domain-containing protein n=1 Tax=Marixanthomonas sp. SCSIO 43207 TaxID=2779360 RepID=UPI001CAA3839|nr:ferritin-like domain-containing protein [Marixanthomonas sp. SCSIO 43207]UAB82084.1 ferritin-like domain-containing protein [Marixanthomonas sp. SCSIO 43207]
MEKNKIKVHDVKPIRSNRRRFLKLSGAAALGTSLLMMGCSDDDDMPPPPDSVFDLGTGDVGVLNYAYALEQLEADFYDKVVNDSNFNATFNENERQILIDLYNHEVIHRDFFNTAISAAVQNQNQVLPTLEFDYGNLDFGNREQVLTTSRDLEDTGVAAYNGAGKLISNAGYLLVAGKIVSVEARHAAAIRDLLNPGSTDFAGDDIVSPENGLGRALDPVDIVDIAGQFITTPFTYMEQGIG